VIEEQKVGSDSRTVSEEQKGTDETDMTTTTTNSSIEPIHHH